MISWAVESRFQGRILQAEGTALLPCGSIEPVLLKNRKEARGIEEGWSKVSQGSWRSGNSQGLDPVKPF